MGGQLLFARSGPLVSHSNTECKPEVPKVAQFSFVLFGTLVTELPQYHGDVMPMSLLPLSQHFCFVFARESYSFSRPKIRPDWY